MQQKLFIKMGHLQPLFVNFQSFHISNVTQIDCNDKSVDGVIRA